MSSPKILQLPPLARQKMAQLTAQAKNMGVTPELLAKQFVEDALELRRESESRTFAEIMGPVRKMSGKIHESDFFGLVDKARTDAHRGTARRKKR